MKSAITLFVQCTCLALWLFFPSLWESEREQRLARELYLFRVRSSVPSACCTFLDTPFASRDVSRIRYVLRVFISTSKYRCRQYKSPRNIYSRVECLTRKIVNLKRVHAGDSSSIIRRTPQKFPQNKLFSLSAAVSDIYLWLFCVPVLIIKKIV